MFLSPTRMLWPDRIFGSRNRLASVHARGEKRASSLSLLGTRDTAIINTSTQPRTKIFAGVRGTRTRPRCTSAFTPSARVRGPWMHSRLVLLRSLAMVNVVLLLPLRSLLPRGSHFSLLRAMCTNSDALILSLSLCSSPSLDASKCGSSSD